MSRKAQSDDERALELPVPAAGAKPKFHSFGPWLFAVVTPTGKRSWYMRYPSPTRSDAAGNPIRRDLKLGNIGVMLVGEAREIVKDHRRTVEVHQKDPADIAGQAKVRTQRKGNFEACARAALEFKKDEWRVLQIRDKPVCNTYDVWLSNFERFVIPIIGPLGCDHVDVPAVLSVLEQDHHGAPLWRGAHSTALQVRNQIKYALDYGAANEFRDPNLRNPADPGALEFKLTAMSPVSMPFAAAPLATIPKLMQTLAARDGVRPLCLRAVFLTAKRTKAIGLARWPEIDWEGRIWTIPTERLKFKKGSALEAHYMRAGGWREPITDALLDVLKTAWALRAADDGYIFLGYPRTKHIAVSRLVGVLHDLGCPETVHGTSRAGFKAWATVRDPVTTQYRVEYRLSELCSGRDLRTKTQRAYDREPDGLFDRTPVMQAWATFCTSAMPRDNVVQFTDAAD